MKQVKLIYVMGVGRTGSTLLGNKLQTLGYGAFVCELFWWITHEYHRDSGIIKCECGNTVQKCDFWSKINIEKSILTTDYFANRNLVTFFFPFSKKLFNDKKKIEFLVKQLLIEFQSPIIETSKSPIIASFLKHIYGDQIFIIKTKRPTKQIIKSWSTPKGYLPKRNSIVVLSEIMWYNILMYFMKLRGDIDLELSVDDILDLKNIDVIKSKGFNRHTIAGNPSR